MTTREALAMDVDLLVLGSGVAGLSAARRGAQAGLRVTLVTKADLGDSTTRYAQGGVGAAMEAPDSPALHAADTLAVGGGLCDPDAVEVLAVEGPEAVRDLMAAGAEFDPVPAGPALDRAQEGGHSVRRVLHAGGDATGAEVERAQVAAASESGAELCPRVFAAELIVEDGRCAGVTIVDDAGGTGELRARHTVLATGGAGQLFSVTTNPSLATGDGFALALRAGVAVADLEFVQFHPTALHHPAMPRPLLSEALRGEGAVLRDDAGSELMPGRDPRGDLAPRDVVAHAIANRLATAGVDHVWLDATGVEAIEARFPNIVASCRRVGLDPATDWLPVAPAAHYVCGGVLTDLDGATTLPGLWACGEAAGSGVHGANRLASNSLLDGLVFSARAVAAIVDGRDGPRPTGAMRGVEPWVAGHGAPEPVRVAATAATDGDTAAGRERLQQAMTRGAGVVRDAAGLDQLAEELTTMPIPTRADVGDRLERHELRNLATVAAALVRAARAREESRGAHQRRDFPATDDRFAGRFVSVGDEDRFVPLPDAVSARSGR